MSESGDDNLCRRRTGDGCSKKSRKKTGCFSTDPVALDQACIDLVYEQKDGDGKALVNRIESKNGLLTLEHAEKLDLAAGNTNCRCLIRINRR